MIGAIIAHELRRYSENGQLPPASAESEAALGLDPSLADSTPLCGALTAFTEVVVARLGIFGAFVSLTDGRTQRVLAGTWREPGGRIHDSAAPRWLAPTDGDRAGWLWLGRRTIGLEEGRGCQSPSDHAIVTRLDQDEHTSRLSCVLDQPQLRHYAAAPITTEHGINIGCLFAVDNLDRLGFPGGDLEFLVSMARKCMIQFETARESYLKRRVTKISDGLSSFIHSRAIIAGTEEEPPPLHRSNSHQYFDGEAGPAQPNPDLDDVAKEIVRSTLGDSPKEESGEPRTLSAQPDTTESSTDGVVETGYGKAFRRAAEFLRAGLDVDGVLFVDGLVGHHGTLLPVEEPEQELEDEIAQRPERRSPPNSDVSCRGQSPTPQTHAKMQSKDASGPAERIFTSAEYQKSVLTRRPAEILGISMVTPETKLSVKRISPTTLGLDYVDEGFLQIFLAKNTAGRIWYFDEQKRPFISSGDILLPDDDPDGDAKRLASAFPEARQIVFAPLTDPVTLKRLSGCFAWTSRVLPVFTEAADLGPVRGFLHSVEAEISRIDTVAAVKQQESFVSSVSHELRTPLHGILGAVEFLGETQLDSFQQGLAESIRYCGSTLHDTLSSVLSYAKINQFERRRSKPKQRGAQDSPWALENKDISNSTERNLHGLFCSANIATLCEETFEVTVGGHAYTRLAAANHLVITLDVRWLENWNFLTEPGALRRIMSNVIGNALKYTETGFVRVGLDVGATQNDSSHLDNLTSNTKLLIFSVKDSGKGMSKEFLEKHLFIPFTQEDTVASQGVGLGMSIVKSLVAILGGKIEVSSQPGKGSEFTVSIPMAQGDPEPPSPAAATLDKALPELRRNRLNVAICGFHPYLQESLQKHLRDWLHCNILPLDEEILHPDILIVDQADKYTSDDVRVRYHPARLALLTVSDKPSLRRSGGNLDRIFRIRQTISRPIGPYKLSKALLACTENLVAEPRAEDRHMDEEVEQLSRLMQAVEIDGTSANAMDMADLPSPTKPARHLSPEEHPSDVISPSKPLQPADTPLASHESSDQQGRPPHLLLVEDNAINLKLLKTFMLKNGYSNLATAENGKLAVNEVLTATEANRGFDIIFMDISMPVMDGLEATRAIRNIERLHRDGGQWTRISPAYIVALTGLASAKDEKNAYESGMDLVITKPVKFEKLSDLLTKWKRGAEEQYEG